MVDEDLTRIDPHDLVDVPVNATILGGEVVYERQGAKQKQLAAAAAAARDDQGHGKRCYEGGTCCCVLTEEIRAGRV